MLPPKDIMSQQGFGPKDDRFKRPNDAGTLSPEGAFGPPKFEQEEKPSFADQGRINQAYQQFEEPEYQPELEQPIEDDEPEYGFDAPPAWQGAGEMPIPPSFRQEGGSFLRDEPLFEGGPMRSEINSWKKQFEQDGHSLHLTEHRDEIFIWRTLSRTEYREVMALPNTDPLQREEIFCEICTLWPYQYNFSSMANRKAGVPSVLAEQIMHESGFSKPSPPIRL